MKIKLVLLLLEMLFSKKVVVPMLCAIFFTLNISAQTDTLFVPEDTLALPADTLGFHQDSIVLVSDTLILEIDTFNIPEDTLVLEEDSLAIPQDSLDYDDDNNALNNLDTIVAKTTKIIIEEDTLPVYSISVGKLGHTFPCGSRFGISLQAPGYHIFSAESPYNATYVPNSSEINWPDDDDGSSKNNMAYQNSFNRIKQLRVGTVESSFGKRWTISSEQFKSNYSNLFDFDFDGDKRFSGDYNNLFFEMLISIQQLAKENENLKSELADTKSRLDAIEAKLDLTQSDGVRGHKSRVQINPNPSNNGILNIEYTLADKIKNANLQLFDSSGKLLYQIPITNRGSGSFTQFFNLTTGVYFYQLMTDGNKDETLKLIIQ